MYLIDSVFKNYLNLTYVRLYIKEMHKTVLIFISGSLRNLFSSFFFNLFNFFTSLYLYIVTVLGLLKINILATLLIRFTSYQAS